MKRMGVVAAIIAALFLSACGGQNEKSDKVNAACTDSLAYMGQQICLQRIDSADFAQVHHQDSRLNLRF